MTGPRRFFFDSQVLFGVRVGGADRTAEREDGAQGSGVTVHKMKRTRSKWFVGSSSSRICGRISRSNANATRAF